MILIEFKIGFKCETITDIDRSNYTYTIEYCPECNGFLLPTTYLRKEHILDSEKVQKQKLEAIGDK